MFIFEMVVNQSAVRIKRSATTVRGFVWQCDKLNEFHNAHIYKMNAYIIHEKFSSMLIFFFRRLDMNCDEVIFDEYVGNVFHISAARRVAQWWFFSLLSQDDEQGKVSQ